MGPNENKIAGNMNSMIHSYPQFNGAGLNVAWVRSNRNKTATSAGGQKEKKDMVPWSMSMCVATHSEGRAAAGEDQLTIRMTRRAEW